MVGWSPWEPLVVAVELSKSLEVLGGRSDAGMACSLEASRGTSSVRTPSKSGHRSQWSLASF